MATRRALPCGLLALTALLAGCGTSAKQASSPTGAIPVRADDASCAVGRTDLTAGRQVFAISNAGSRVTEVYLYAAGDRIVAEKENIGPGLSYELTVEMPAGRYEVACKPGQTGSGIRTVVTVAGAATQTPADSAAAQAVTAYRAYVQSRADAMLPLVVGFADAVKAGDITKAKALYAPSRAPWEAIEPVAESFGDLDPRIDQRAADLAPGATWTGWHRLEKTLWQDGTTAGAAPVANQLVADVTELRGRIPTAQLTVAGIANGAKELIDEVATTKVTGEEETFSHTDLYDLAANLAGAHQAVEVLRPLVQAHQPGLLPTLDAAFADVDSTTANYAREADFVSYDTVDQADRRDLSRVIDALGAPLSQLAAAATR